MRAGLSSNPLSSTLTIGPVRMLVIVGAENSRRVLLAIASNSGVKLRLIWLSSDFKARTDEDILLCSLESVPMPRGQIHCVVAKNFKFSHVEHWSCLWERTLLER